MKKQVRIRKALPGETPGYYNKTAKFLKKAAMGMEVSTTRTDPARINQIYDHVYISLKNDGDADTLYYQLLNQYALDNNTASMLIDSAMAKLADEGYVDPDTVKTEDTEGAEGQPQDPQKKANEDAERAASDAEQEELAMSNDIYAEDEERMNDTSHLETEQAQQEQGFRTGGYYDEGGESEEDDSQYVDPEQAALDQYYYPGTQMQRPFSMEELLANTPGVQNNEIPDIRYYMPDYNPVSSYYQAEDYLPTGAEGGVTPPIKNLFSGLGSKLTLPIIPTGNPLTNLSAARKIISPFTLLGEGMTRLPYLGAKFTPKLTTPFTQNRTELWNVLNGATPKLGTFSQNGTMIGGADGSLQADRLLLYQDDVKKITEKLKYGENNFTLGDIYPTAEQDGLVSGIYPMETKIIGGVDDNGNQFFELKHGFGPNQQLPFGTTPTKAKEVTFKNRFYYNTDPETGGLKIFDPLGNELMAGVQTKSHVNRAVLPSWLSANRDVVGRDMNLSGEGTPFPSYFDSVGKFGRRQDITGLPPLTWNDLSTRGKIGRGIETFATTGLNQFFRTGAKNIQQVDYPVYGYANAALGPNIQNPASIPFSQTASDIKNAINYKYRLGLKTALYAGIPSYLGYKIYDSFANPCQCDDANEPNFMAKDTFGKCPCGTDVGPTRVLDPEAIPVEENTVEPSDLERPDSIQFLEGQHPSDYNYYRYNDSNIVNPNIQNEAIGDDFKKGGVTKNRFIKKMVEMYAEGGDTDLGLFGQGKRTDTLTDDVTNRKTSFLNTLKNNSNKAVSADIYKNAQGNPQVLNMLMKDGPKENLAEDAFETNKLSTDPTAAYGGFIDMDSDDPLTKFIYGGDETEYYEPYGLTQARDGITIQNREGDLRGVQGQMDFDEWSQGEQEDWEAANPGEDFEAWRSSPEAQDSYINYINFYNDSLDEYFNEGQRTRTFDPNAPGVVSDTFNPCGAGTVWSKTYQMCVPKATINPIPTPVRMPQGLFRTLAPWNPALTAAGSWVKQKGTPYYINDGQSYNGLMPSTPVASYTTKKGLLGGRKKWIDIYEVDGDGTGTGVPMEDLSQFEQMMRHRPNKAGKKPSRKEYLNSKLREDSWNNENWDQLSERDKRAARNTYTFENEDERNLWDNIRYRAQGTRYSESGRTKKVKERRLGGESESTNGFGNSSNSSVLDPFSASGNLSANQSQANSLGQPPINYNPMGDNPFSFDKEQGHTLGKSENAGDKKYVGVERKRKDVYNVDPEGMINVGNNAARGVLGAWDRIKNAKIEFNNTLDTTDPYNNYASSYDTNKGNWVDTGHKAGSLNYDKEGSDRNSQSTFGSGKRYGGYMAYGGYTEPGYEDDEEVYMTPEELEQFLAAGGQVEYL